MKTKILYAITRSDWGGAQRYVFDLATNLPKEQYEVLVATGGNGPLIQKLREQHIRVTIIETLEKNVALFKDVQSIAVLVNIIKKERPNIVHLNSSKIGLMGAIAAKLTNVPQIIFTVHGWAFNENRHLIMQQLFKLLTWCSLLLHDTIICVSQKLYDEAPVWGINKAKLIVVKNGVTETQLYKQQLARTLLLKTKENPPILTKNMFWMGTIAELTPNKGIRFGIHAFTYLRKKNIAWLIMGSGDEQKKLAQLVKKMKLEKNIYFLGHVPNAAQYMKAFDVILIPSITEACSYVLLETGAAKIPVIASNVGGIPEIIEHYKTGFLVEPKNTQAIARAIEYVINNQSLAKKTAEELQKRVRKEFTFKQMLEKTEMVYQL